MPKIAMLYGKNYWYMLRVVRFSSPEEGKYFPSLLLCKDVSVPFSTEKGKTEYQAHNQGLFVGLQICCAGSQGALPPVTWGIAVYMYIYYILFLSGI